MKTDTLRILVLSKWSYNVLNLTKYRNSCVYYGNFTDSVSHYLDL